MATSVFIMCQMEKLTSHIRFAHAPQTTGRICGSYLIGVGANKSDFGNGGDKVRLIERIKNYFKPELIIPSECELIKETENGSIYWDVEEGRFFYDLKWTQKN